MNFDYETMWAVIKNFNRVTTKLLLYIKKRILRRKCPLGYSERDPEKNMISQQYRALDGRLYLVIMNRAFLYLFYCKLNGSFNSHVFPSNRRLISWIESQHCRGASGWLGAGAGMAATGLEINRSHILSTYKRGLPSKYTTGLNNIDSLNCTEGVIVGYIAKIILP